MLRNQQLDVPYLPESPPYAEMPEIDITLSREYLGLIFHLLSV
jgi:hypothetical protein